VPYKLLFSEAMEFPLVSPSDLETFLKGEPGIELKLEGSSTRRKPNPDLDDRVVVNDRAALEMNLEDENEQFKITQLGFRIE
jgi:hypothetical protein